MQTNPRFSLSLLTLALCSGFAQAADTDAAQDASGLETVAFGIRIDEELHGNNALYGEKELVLLVDIHRNDVLTLPVQRGLCIRYEPHFAAEPRDVFGHFQALLQRFSF